MFDLSTFRWATLIFVTVVIILLSIALFLNPDRRLSRKKKSLGIQGNTVLNYTLEEKQHVISCVDKLIKDKSLTISFGDILKKYNYNEERTLVWYDRSGFSIVMNPQQLEHELIYLYRLKKELNMPSSISELSDTLKKEIKEFKVTEKDLGLSSDYVKGK